MQPAVKYGVYYDILRRVPIYVTKCCFLLKTPQNTRLARLLLGGPTKKCGRPKLSPQADVIDSVRIYKLVFEGHTLV